jgi:hypothetical protein
MIGLILPNKEMDVSKGPIRTEIHLEKQYCNIGRCHIAYSSSICGVIYVI